MGEVMANALEALQDQAARNPGVSIFAGPKGLSEEQQLERFAALVGEPSPVAKQEDAPVVAAQTEQPVTPVVVEQVATPEVVTPEVVEPARMAVPAVDLEALSRELMESGVDEETAKKLAAGTIGRLAQASAVAAAETERSRRDRLVSKYGAVYPELKRPGALDMLVNGASDDAAVHARITMMFGDRKAQMRNETAQQMTAPNRQVAKDKPKTKDEIEYAVFAEYFNSGGNMAKAQALKQDLTSGQ
jgi:hypothetical protein